MRRIARYTAIILATLSLLFVLWQFQVAVFLFLLSLALSAAVRPAVERLADRGLPRVVALLATYALLILVGTGLLLLVGQPLLGEFQTLSDDFITFYEGIRDAWPEGSPFQQMVAGQLPVPGDLYDALTSEQGMEVTQAAVGFTSDLFSFLSRLAIVVILSVYWTAERIHFERLILFLVPVEWRPRSRDVWRAVEDSVGAYIRSEGLQSVLAGLLLGLGMWGVGLPYPLLLALFGALLRPIPWLGPLLATVLAFILGWTVGFGRGVVAAIFTLVVFLLIKAWLEPRLFHRRRYSSVLMALVVLILFNVSGLLGAILAPLVGIVIQIISLHFLKQKSWREEVQASGQFDELRERLESVQARIADLEESPSPELTSLANRLEGLLDQAAVFLTEERDGGALNMTTHESV